MLYRGDLKSEQELPDDYEQMEINDEILRNSNAFKIDQKGALKIKGNFGLVLVYFFGLCVLFNCILQSCSVEEKVCVLSLSLSANSMCKCDPPISFFSTLFCPLPQVLTKHLAQMYVASFIHMCVIRGHVYFQTKKLKTQNKYKTKS